MGCSCIFSEYKDKVQARGTNNILWGLGSVWVLGLGLGSTKNLALLWLWVVVVVVVASVGFISHTQYLAPLFPHTLSFKSMTHIIQAVRTHYSYCTYCSHTLTHTPKPMALNSVATNRAHKYMKKGTLKRRSALRQTQLSA